MYNLLCPGGIVFQEIRRSWPIIPRFERVPFEVMCHPQYEDPGSRARTYAFYHAMHCAPPADVHAVLSRSLEGRLGLLVGACGPTCSFF